MCSRQGREGIALRLDRRDFPTAVMQPGRKVLYQYLTIGMGQLLGQGHRFLAPLHSLRRIAKTPQCEGRMEKTHHPRRFSMAERQGPLRRRVGEGYALLAVHPGGGVFAQEGQNAREYVMRLQAGRWCSCTLCELVELFPQLPCRRQCSLVAIEST